MRGIEKGVFRAVDSSTVAGILIAPLIHLALWRHSFGATCCQAGVGIEAYLDGYFDLVLNGLRPPGESSGGA